MICDDCLHQWECFEQRGPCREYKDMEMIRREIIGINNAYKAKAAAGAEAGDEADLQPEDVRRGSEDPRSEAPDTVAHGDP